MGWLKDFIKNPVKRLTKDVKNAFNFVGDLVSGAIGFVGDLFGMNFMPEMPQADIGARNQGTTVNRTGGAQPIPLIYTNASYGEVVKMGGIRVFTASDGENNKYLYVTYILGYGAATSIRVIDEAMRKSVTYFTGFQGFQDYGFAEIESGDGNTKEADTYTYNSGRS